MQTPVVVRKYVSSHLVQETKLFIFTQVEQPDDPLYVVSVQRMHKFDIKIPAEHEVHVEPSLQLLQFVGQDRQCS